MDTQAGYLISRIRQVGGRVFQKLLDRSGIVEFNGAQGKILYVLWTKGEMPISELSALTGLAKNTLTSMLDRMENSGLLRRQADPKDRRRIRIALTAEAVRLREAYEAVSQEMNALYFQGFRPEEIRQLEALLQRILDNIEGGPL